MFKLILQSSILINTSRAVGERAVCVPYPVACADRRQLNPPASSGLPSFATEKLNPISLAAASSASTWV